jgi:phospholipid transport system substrate-binding protein
VIRKFLALFAFLGTFLLAGPLHAQGVAPDAFVRQLSDDVLESIKSDKAVQGGDVSRIRALVDAKVLPHVNFQRMTAATVGRPWRTATPQQQQRLEEEFKTLLVRTEVRGGNEPIQLDYRLEKAGDGWKIYDVNVLGVWLVDQYKNSFAQEIAAGGIDGLIAKLAERNKTGGKG